MSYIKRITLEEEYNKDTGITREDISSLRQWLSTQPHLPGEHITELDLILTYHCCNRSSEVAKQLLDLHFTLRTLFTSFFKDRIVDEKMLNVLNIMLATPLEIRSHDGYAVFYGRLIDYDSKKFHLSQCLRTALMVLDLWQYEEGTWPGFILLADLEGLSLGHLAKMDLPTLQQYFCYLQEALLLKLKGLHLLNAPPFMDKLMMLLKPFMKTALLEMLYIHQVGSRTLEKHLPMIGLPKEAGGEFKSISEASEEIIAKVKANKEFFSEENKKRVTERLRAGKPKTISDIFGGVEGSFKKLDID